MPSSFKKGEEPGHSHNGKAHSRRVNNSVFYDWDLLTIFWDLGSSFHSTYSSSSRRRLLPLHCCWCSCWPSHGAGIPRYWHPPNSRQLGCTFTNSLSWCQTSADSFSPTGASTVTPAAPSPVASHRSKPQLLSMTPSCLQNQDHMEGSYT